MLFVIPNLDASRVNLLMNDYAAGLPSPLAFLGLTDSIVRELKLPAWSGRCLPILHAVVPSVGRTKAAMVPSSTIFSPVEIVEDMVGTVRISLIIDLPGWTDSIRLSQVLEGRRIAGGVIHNRTINAREVTADGSAFRYLSRGFAMVPVLDPDGPILCGGQLDEFAALARRLYPVDRPPGFGWIAPVAAGYRLLEDPATAPRRAGTRDADVPHVFVEPLAGVAELISVRNKRLTSLGADEFSKLLWSWTARDGLVLGHSAYLPTNN